MIRPDQIPEEVVEALQNALLVAFSQTKETTYEQIIAAALNAWPGSYSLAENDSAIILPLTEGDGQ